MQSFTEKRQSVNGITGTRPELESIHCSEGLTAEDKRLFLSARLRLLHRKIARHSPVSREELTGLVAYAYGSEADDHGAAA